MIFSKRFRLSRRKTLIVETKKSLDAFGLHRRSNGLNHLISRSTRFEEGLLCLDSGRRSEITIRSG